MMPVRSDSRDKTVSDLPHTLWTPRLTFYFNYTAYTLFSNCMLACDSKFNPVKKKYMVSMHAVLLR